MLKEWPLVAFTILGQMAVGVCLLVVLPLSLYAGSHFFWTMARDTMLVFLTLVFGLLAAAAALSFFHLHHPFRARRVLTNLRTSWLSREILFELVFMALIALAFALVWTDHTAGLFFNAVLAAASIAGILFLISMTKLYMLSTLPVWNLAYTPLSFAATTLNLGALLTALVLWARSGFGYYSGGLLGLSFVLVVCEFVLAVLALPRYGVFEKRPAPSLRPPAATPRLLCLWRLEILAASLVFIGLGLLLWRAIILLAIALLLVLAGEVAGRFHFYGLVARPGR